MDYRSFGKSGVKVSPICLGTMNFGNRTDRVEAGRIVDAARDAGVNFIDTADIYAQGESEQMVGELIAKDRDWWILATKVGEPMGARPNQQGLSARWIKKAAHDSLRRLRTDRIDVYYAHLDDEATPLEETLRALDDLVRAGDIVYIGLSNYPSWRIGEAVHLCRELGLSQPVVCQPCYHMLERTPESELLPACGHYGLAVVPYSPLARGILSGKYRADAEPPADSRAGRGDGMTARMMETEWRSESLVIAEHVKVHAERKGMTTSQFALGWVLNNGLVAAAIAGPRTLEQWTEYLGSLEHRIEAEDEEFVDRLVPAGHPSTPGYRDPAYPLRGRIPISQ